MSIYIYIYIYFARVLVHQHYTSRQPIKLPKELAVKVFVWIIDTMAIRKLDLDRETANFDKSFLQPTSTPQKKRKKNKKK